MNRATLSFLRYMAFWTDAQKHGLSTKHPDVREIEEKLSRDFVRKMRIVKVSDVN